MLNNRQNELRSSFSQDVLEIREESLKQISWQQTAISGLRFLTIRMKKKDSVEKSGILEALINDGEYSLRYLGAHYLEAELRVLSKLLKSNR
jgi:hypothetical protein